MRCPQNYSKNATVVFATALIFGSVVPIVVAALEPGSRTVAMTTKLTLIDGIAYGLAFAVGCGLLGAIVGAVT